ncbi:MAG TPA: hypothetical protein VFX54_21205, partial [Candidatus Binatia bacterium]|nr:hypothetical protein [Candidatus Binatia bacterium]
SKISSSAPFMYRFNIVRLLGLFVLNRFEYMNSLDDALYEPFHQLRIFGRRLPQHDYASVSGKLCIANITAPVRKQ